MERPKKTRLFKVKVLDTVYIIETGSREKAVNLSILRYKADIDTNYSLGFLRKFSYTKVVEDRRPTWRKDRKESRLKEVTLNAE